MIGVPPLAADVQKVVRAELLDLLAVDLDEDGLRFEDGVDEEEDLLRLEAVDFGVDADLWGFQEHVHCE